MTTSRCLFANISTIYIASAQTSNFRLLRIYDFASVHLPIIYELQIDKLLHDWKSSTSLIIVHRKIVWQLQIPYSETFRAFMWPQRKSPIFLTTAHHAFIFLLRISQLFVYCKSTKYFTNGNRINMCLLCFEKLYGNFKSPI